MHARHRIYHIPICPFSQRLEILLELKGARDQVDFEAVDITQPRPAWLLALTGGSTALPVMLTPEGVAIKESLVILDYLDEAMPGARIARSNPVERAVERMLVAQEGAFTAAGYRYVMNRDRQAMRDLRAQLLRCYEDLDRFLSAHARHECWLFDDYGIAELVFTPLFMRFWFVEYYEDFELPRETRFARVRRWRDACIAHPAAQQTSREEIVKLYYDYALGLGNGALPAGRARSSFSFEPHWRTRPWPPRDKFLSVTDAQLGLV